MNEERKGMLASGAAYSIFGLSYLFSTMGIGVTGDPIILLSIRFAVTFLALNVLVFTRMMKLELKGKNILGPLLLGILNPVMYFLFENYGLKFTSTAFAGMVSSVNPIFTAILGAVMLRERPTARQWLFICISIAGVMMVSLGANEGRNTLFGCVCLLTAYFTGSLNCIFVRRLTKKFSAFELTYLAFCAGFAGFAVLPFIKYGGNAAGLLTAALSSGKFVISVLYLGLLASVGAYMLSNYALARLPVARMAIFSSCSTVISVLSGVIIMHDEFPLINVLAFVLMLAGVWGVNHYERPAA